MSLRKHALYIDHTAADALVERPAPGAAPVAFRIWKAGENVADDGSVLFTEASAKKLIEEQTSRGRTYPSDFDHLSLETNRPAEAGRASGWHTLEVRNDANGAPELWATNIEWCADARAGLEEQPPRWKYFSPAFMTDGKTGEIVSYANFALCINPKTHGLPALASITKHTGGRMDPKKCAQLLAGMLDSAEGDKKEALAMALKAMVGDDDKEEKKKDDADGDSDGDKKEEKKEATEGEGASDPEKPKKDEEEPEAKSHAASGGDLKKATVDLAASNVELKKRVDRLEIEKLIDSRKDLSDSVRAWCLTEDPAVVRGFLGKVNKVHSVARSEKPTQGSNGGPALLEGAEREAVDQAMGMTARTAQMPRRLEDGRFEMHTVRPSDYRASVAKKGNV